MTTSRSDMRFVIIPSDRGRMFPSRYALGCYLRAAEAQQRERRYGNPYGFEDTLALELLCLQDALDTLNNLNTVEDGWKTNP